MKQRPYITVTIDRLSVPDEHHLRTDIETELESSLAQLLQEQFSKEEHEHLNVLTSGSTVHAEVRD